MQQQCQSFIVQVVLMKHCKQIKIRSITAVPLIQALCALCCLIGNIMQNINMFSEVISLSNLLILFSDNSGKSAIVDHFFVRLCNICTEQVRLSIDIFQKIDASIEAKTWMNSSKVSGGQTLEREREREKESGGSKIRSNSNNQAN